MSTIIFDKYVYNFSLCTECDACKKFMVMGYYSKYTEICDHCYIKHLDPAMDIKNKELSYQQYIRSIYTNIHRSFLHNSLLC